MGKNDLEQLRRLIIEVLMELLLFMILRILIGTQEVITINPDSFANVRKWLQEIN